MVDKNKIAKVTTRAVSFRAGDGRMVGGNALGVRAGGTLLGAKQTVKFAEVA